MRFSLLMRGLLALGLLLGWLPGARAQVTQEVFGPNRIQYRRFQWQIYGTTNFNVYHYAGGQEVARNAAELAEKELRRVSSLIGYYPYAKTTLILYNSVADLRQSNIGLDDAHYQTGGETALSKNRIELAFDGRQPQFRRDLSYRLTRLLLQDMLYGGSLKDQLRSTYLLQLPPWFVDGAAAYVAEGWSHEMDDFIRSEVRRTPQRKLETILTRNPRLAGQSIWNYVAERYGYTSLQNVLNLTRITRDEEIGFASSLNVPPRQFMRAWFTYYFQQNDRPPVPYAEVDDAQRLRPKNRRGLLFTEPVLSPDGQTLAYVENDRGTYRVRVRSVATGKERQLLRGGFKTPDQQLDVRMPLLAWRTATQLAIAEMRRGRVELRLKSLSGKRADEEGILTRFKLAVGLAKGSGALAGFEQVLDMSYSADGKQLALSAVRGGQSDIYVLRAGQRAAQAVTSDAYDDLHPVFLPDGSLVFSSNRSASDSLGTDKGTFARAVDNFDLFRATLGADGATGGTRFRTLTSGIANETRPRAAAPGQVVYLSEESGIRSVWRLDLVTGQRQALTGFGEAIKTFDLHPTTGHLAFVFAEQGREYVALYPSYPPPAGLTLSRTVRQETLEDRAARAAASKTPAPVAQPVKPAAPTPAAPPADSAAKKAPTTAGAPAPINTDDYQFDAEPPKPRVRRRTPVTAFTPPPPPTSAIAGPVPYDIRFGTTDVVTSLYADPLLGTGLVGEVRMADVLENHRIRAGAFTLTDFRTNHVYGEYSYLGRRYDLKANYLKSTYLLGSEAGNLFRISRHSVTGSFIYPLTHSLSVRLSPTVVATRLTIVNQFTLPDQTTNFAGGTAEAVYDNSIITGLNQMEGTRMKLGYLKLQAFGQPQENFSKLYFDGRHYQKIYRGLVWATRVSAGAFLGAAPKQFILGGVDNWVFNSRQDEELRFSAVPADLFYQQFVLPMRGFVFGARTGPRHLLLNTELRWPIVQFLAGNAQISSGFFRNLQLTAFFDAGSAYSGANPFTTDNSFNTQTVINRPFTARVINFRNPFLYGYGAGARTTLLGFYLKYDLGWGIQDGVELRPVHHWSLGYDF